MLAGLASPLRAQDPDFLFGRPNGTIAFHLGWHNARAGSDLFTFVQDKLTVDKNDFDAPAVGVDVDVPVTSRLSMISGFEYSGSSKDSEYRSLVDNNRLPIAQTTTLQQLNLSYGVKLSLMPPGRSISAHAWIPSAVTPYVGAGVGALWYKFHQKGDFVDYTDSSVFPKEYDSRGWAPSVHVLGGVDVKAWKRLYLNGEARYLWSHATLGREFSGFDPIDLAGLKIGAGIRYMF
jgi:hypothetical protein